MPSPEKEKLVPINKHSIYELKRGINATIANIFFEEEYFEEYFL